MRGGTGRLITGTGRVPGSRHVYVSIVLSHAVYMEAGRFSSRLA